MHLVLLQVTHSLFLFPQFIFVEFILLIIMHYKFKIIILNSCGLLLGTPLMFFFFMSFDVIVAKYFLYDIFIVTFQAYSQKEFTSERVNTNHILLHCK